MKGFILKLSMQIKITQRNDYEFPQPAFGFGQTLIDSENDEGFVVGMQFTSESWQYQLFYTKLEVIGKWMHQDSLASEVMDI